MVKSSADALLTIINDILDFTKIEAGKLDLDPSAFALRDTLGDALKPLAVAAHAKGLELACHVAPDVPDGWWATRPAAAGTPQPGGQRREVHRAGRGRRPGRRRVLHRRAKWQLHFAVSRHGRRHPGRPGWRRSSSRSAGRRVHDPEVRRYRPGAGHLPTPGRDDGRSALGRERGWARAPRSTSPLVLGADPTGACRAARRGVTGCGCWWRMPAPPPRDPRGDAGAVADARRRRRRLARGRSPS